MGLYNKNLADDTLENKYSYPNYYSMFRKGGIIKLQNAGSVPQVDNTRISKPLMKYQASTIQQDHDALVK